MIPLEQRGNSLLQLAFVCFSFFLATCARLLTSSLSFLVHVNLFFRIVSQREDRRTEDLTALCSASRIRVV